MRIVFLPLVAGCAVACSKPPDAGAQAARPLPLEARADSPEGGDGEPARALEEARARLRRGEAAQAEALLQRIIREHEASPLSDEAADELARIALARGDRGLAEKAISERPAGARRPFRLELVAALAESDAKRGDSHAAAAVYSRALEGMAAQGAAYAEMRSAADRLDALNREFLFNPAGSWRSEVHVVARGDSWHGIAKRIAAERGVRHGIGLLRAVNRKSGDLLNPGERLRIPIDPVRIVVVRSSFAAFVYLGDLLIRMYPAGIGRGDAETPTGRFEIGKKDPKPVWWKPKPPLPYGHPENPLGSRWLGFRVEGRDIPYGIHGTEREDAVGGRVSQGCIRLLNRDIEELYDLVPDSGTPVEIR